MQGRSEGLLHELILVASLSFVCRVACCGLILKFCWDDFRCSGLLPRLMCSSHEGIA